MAATAYHLGSFRRAYSLLAPVQADHNFSPLERALCHLILGNLSELERLALTSRLGGDGTDASLRASLEERPGSERIEDPSDDNGSVFFESIDRALTDNFFGALAVFLFALERGERAFVDRSRAMLEEGFSVAADLSLLPQCQQRVAGRLLRCCGALCETRS
jgi:hypothetical protein